MCRRCLVHCSAATATESKSRGTTLFICAVERSKAAEKQQQQHTTKSSSARTERDEQYEGGALNDERIMNACVAVVVVAAV
jgi:hypothetical protein